MVAIQFIRPEAVRALPERGADANTSGALAHVVLLGNEEILKYLLDTGSTFDNRHSTALLMWPVEDVPILLSSCFGRGADANTLGEGWEARLTVAV